MSKKKQFNYIGYPLIVLIGLMIFSNVVNSFVDSYLSIKEKCKNCKKRKPQQADSFDPEAQKPKKDKLNNKIEKHRNIQNQLQTGSLTSMNNSVNESLKNCPLESSVIENRSDHPEVHPLDLEDFQKEKNISIYQEREVRTKDSSMKQVNEQRRRRNKKNFFKGQNKFKK